MPLPFLACATTWVPTEWAAGVREGWLLLSNDVAAKPMPSVGNGYVSTIVGSENVYLAGVFSSKDKPLRSHRARLPNAHNIVVAPSEGWPADCKVARAIDTRHGVWLERRESKTAAVASKFYAHRA